MAIQRKRSERTVVQGDVYWRAADAREVLDRWRRSGMSLTTFARSQGLRRRRLEYWRGRLANPAGSRPKFHRVHVVSTLGQQGTAGEAIEIVTARGCRIVVRPGFDGVLLAEVLRVLEELPC
jgi:hypothetical protein